MSEIWEEDTFINPNIPYIFNREIIEYDLKEAGFSITREFNLLPKNKLDKLIKLDKKKRHITIGIYQRDDKIYKENLKRGFIKARKLFIEANHLEKDDIVSIKKDALFICKKCDIQKFGKYLNFRPKNTYTSYIRLDNTVELYYSNNHLDVKGISDDKLELHEKYMIKFLKTYFSKIESEESVNVINYVRRCIDKYKRKEMEAGYYRTFDKRSIIELMNDTDSYVVNDSIKDDIDIRFNLFNIFIKLIKIPL
jgi:hypothetical protein